MTGPEYRIFLHDDDGWSVLGRYETITKRPSSAEDQVEWTTDENDKKFIRVLGVSHITMSFDFYIFIMTIRQHLILVF